MGECSATITTYPTATDDVSGTVVGTTSDPLTYTAQGVYTVHWTYTDPAGNSSYQDQQVIVQDQTPPVFASCAPDVTVDAGPGECSAVVSYDYPAVSDNCAGTLAFAPAVNYPGFAGPMWGSTGDLDGDGDIDLVVNNGAAGSVGVLLNNGDGTFAAVVDNPSGALNNANGRISDLDGDGDNDLVVTSSYSGSVVVMINHGDATFAAPVSYPAYRPSCVGVSDFDGDGDDDLAVAQSYTRGILIMFNRGDGTFTAGGTYPNGDHGGYIVTSDFDADGDYDFAAGSICSGVWLHFNRGDGTFDPAVNYTVGGCNHEISGDDLDGDGDDDLVVGYGDVYGDIPYFSVLLNHGDGTFAAMVNYPTTGGRSVPWPADLDGDGDADLSLLSPRLDAVSLLLNHGDGTFSPPVATYDVGDAPQYICSGDLDGDGDVDLATANHSSNDVSVLLNTSASVGVSATLPPGSTFPVGTTPVTLTASDVAGNTATCTFNVTVRPFPGTTCGGTDVVVAPVDSATGTSPVTFTFAEVTGAGETSLEITGVGPPPPFGFKLGAPPTYYELTTTASYTGPVRICIDYNAISFGNEGRLKLCHREDSHWVDRTVSLDTLSNVVCASVSAFSTFAIFEKVPPASVLGVVTANCPATGTPLFGVTVDAYEMGTGSLVGSDVTDENGCYAIDGLEAGHYSVTIITPLGYAAAADEVPVTVEGVDQTADFALTCVETTAKPRTIGFWKHQIGVATGGAGQGEIDAVTLCAYLDLIEAHFNNHRINSVAVYTPPTSGLCGDKLQVAKDLLNLKGNVAMTARAKQQLMALLLNVASGKIGLRRVISEDGATVSQAITYCDRLIDDPTADHETAKTIADLINNGTMVPAGMIPLDTEQIAYGPPRPETPDLPETYALGQNIPNPFNPTTEIRFDLPVAAHVDLAVYDVSGRLVRRLVGEWMPAGRHWVEWDGRDDGGRTVASGVYFYRVRAGDFTATRRMVLVR